ncbi:MAG: twin-arginine translocation signal domain-containing protein [Alphaproteobacteria bacterium]
MGTRKDDKAGAAPAEGRRFFLKGAGIATAAAVATVAPAPPPAPPPATPPPAAVATVATAGQPAAATEKRDEARKARYRETEHVRRFYATNRY